MNVLLSIKPNYVEQIITGNKKYEFRKSIFSNQNKIDKIFIYSSSPVKKIIGYFKADYIIEDNPTELWHKCGEFAGIKKSKFFEYFGMKNKGYAIVIKDLEIFDKPINPYVELIDFKPPQSFYYVTDDFLMDVVKRKVNVHDTFNRNCGEILRMALHVENYLDFFIANYFIDSNNHKSLIFQDAILNSLNFGRKKDIFKLICKKEEVDEVSVKEILSSISSIQETRNRIAHGIACFFPTENRIILQKKNSILYNKDEIEITDEFIQEIDNKRMLCIDGINEVYRIMDKRQKKDTF